MAGEAECQACRGAHVAHTCSRRRGGRSRGGRVTAPKHLPAGRGTAGSTATQEGGPPSQLADGDTVWVRQKYQPWYAQSNLCQLASVLSPLLPTNRRSKVSKRPR